MALGYRRAVGTPARPGRVLLARAARSGDVPAGMIMDPAVELVQISVQVGWDLEESVGRKVVAGVGVRWVRMLVLDISAAEACGCLHAERAV